MDAPYHSPTTTTSTGSTARRLRRTRQHLGSYRHDLLVAMRVVNSVEQEMLRAEWENWLLDENNRCKQVERMLHQSNQTRDDAPSSSSKGSTQQAMDAKRRNRLDGMRAWYEDYCGSCRSEQDRVFALGKLSSAS